MSAAGEETTLSEATIAFAKNPCFATAQQLRRVAKYCHEEGQIDDAAFRALEEEALPFVDSDAEPGS